MRPNLRVVACDVRGLRRPDVTALGALVAPLTADVAVVAGAPWRIRGRTRSADLAVRLGLWHAAGGPSSVGNLVLVSLRVKVHETWSIQFPLVPGRLLRAAALARCSVPGGQFLVVGTELAGSAPTTAAERTAEAGILARELAGVDVPVILVGNVEETVLTAGRTDAAAGTILVDGGISVRARHFARRSLATTRLPIMTDLLLPAS